MNFWCRFEMSMKVGNGLGGRGKGPGSVKACAVGREGVVCGGGAAKRKWPGAFLRVRVSSLASRAGKSMQSAGAGDGGCAGRKARQLPASAESTVTVIASDGDCL